MFSLQTHLPAIKPIAKDAYLWWGVLLLALIVIADLLSPVLPNIGVAGIIWWAMSFLYIIIYGIASLYWLVTGAVRFKSPFTIFGIAIWIGFIVMYVSNPSSLSGETTQEISCMLRQLGQTQDWGYGRTCFLGYPARQFLIPAIPSLLLGRSLTALHIGSALYVVLGFLLFAKGVWEYLGRDKKSDIVTFGLLGTFLHFPFFLHAMFLFEQSIYPVSFAMMAAGIWLSYLKNASPHYLLLFGIIMMFGIYSYTPGLALVGLGIVLLGAHIFTRKMDQKRKMIADVLLFVLIAEVIMSFTFRKDLDMGSSYIQAIPTLLTDLKDAFVHLVLNTMTYPFMSPVIAFLFLFAIIAPLTGALGRGPWFIAAWVALTFIISVYAKGYVYYSVDFRLHRFIVVIPIVWASMIFATKHMLHTLDKRILIGIALGITCTGVVFTHRYQEARKPNPHAVFIQWLQKQPIDHSSSILLAGAVKPENKFQSLPDSFSYFFPHMTIKLDEAKYENCQLPQGYGLYVYAHTHPCLPDFERVTTPIGTYKDVDETTLYLVSSAP